MTLHLSTRHAHAIHPKYRPDIDGMRALAILSVVTFHAFPDVLHGGFIGVDIFFVISGYLISKIIFESLERDRFSYVDFYVRRIRRIFPAFFVVLAACVAFGWYVMYADEFQRLGQEMVAGVAFFANLLFWRESGYFDASTQSKILLHLWSLGVEEQFYIFWPLIVALLWKRGHLLFPFMIAVSVISFALNVYLLHRHPVAAFYLPIPRFWELMAGALLAWSEVRTKGSLVLPRQTANIVSLIGAAWVFTGLLVIDSHDAFPGYWALLPVAGAVLIILSGSNAWFNRAVLSNQGMVWVGKISYPLYLWHWPLISFAFVLQGNHSHWKVSLCAVVAAFVLAALTTWLVENPLRFGRLKRYSVPLLSALMLAMLLLGGGVALHKIVPRLHGGMIDEIVAARQDWQEIPAGFEKISWQGEHFRYHASASSDGTVIFAGDSHMLQYGSRVSYLLQHHLVTDRNVYFATHEGCIPVRSTAARLAGSDHSCLDYWSSLNSFLQQKNPAVVVIGACWSCYLLPESAHSGVVDEGLIQKVMGNLSQFVEELRSRRVNVWVMTDNPNSSRFDPASALSDNRFAAPTEQRQLPDRIRVNDEQFALDTQIRAVAERSGARVIDPFDSLCDPRHNCLMAVHGDAVYKDNNHLRSSWVQQQAGFVDPTLSN